MKQRVAEMTGASFGKLQDLEALVDEVCSWIGGQESK